MPSKLGPDCYSFEACQPIGVGLVVDVVVVAVSLSLKQHTSSSDRAKWILEG